MVTKTENVLFSTFMLCICVSRYTWICRTALNAWLCRRKDNKQKEPLCSSRFATALTWSAEFEHQNNDAKYQLSMLSESISKWSI